MAEGTRKNPLEYQREYNEFMYKLKRFLSSKDMPMKKLPQFGGEDIDLYLLYKTVTNFGGWLKVTDDHKWHEVAKNFNVPPSCLNSAFALRQLYVRYLEGYEKLYFLGEDGTDDSSIPRVGSYNLGGYGSPQMPVMHKDPQRNFEKLVLSLQSGLPNEVDFAINICVLLSNVNNSVFNLAKAPAVIDMVLAHVGVFEEGSCGLSDLYKEWYNNSGKDFLKFWQRVLNCEEIKQLLPKFDNDKKTEAQEPDVDALFNLDMTATHKDFEQQRVIQVCTILHNFSFDRLNASVLSSHPVCIRFLMFCLHSNIGSLKKLATDTITNLADKMILEPLESLNCQLFFFMIDRYLRESDRYNRICAMSILRKICAQEENQEFICSALDVQSYQALVAVLLLHDVQLLIPALETLYQLTSLGQLPCDCVVAVAKSTEILVSILHVCVESFGADMLAEVKIIDNYHGVAMVPNVSGNKQSPNKLLANSPDPRQRSDADSEVIARHWLRNVYEFDLSSTVLQKDLYADYLTSCGKTTRNALSVASFYKLLRSIHPNIQIVKLNVSNQQLYGLVGLRRKLPPGQYLMQTSVHHGPRVPQGVTPPQPRQSRTASPPTAMDTSHVPRTPTPPIRTEGLATNMVTRPLSPSLPNQRHDVMVPNVRPSLQPSNIQLPIRPQANSAPVPRPTGMTASEFLGSLVGAKLPSGLPSTPSNSSNLTQSSVVTAFTSSGQKVVDAYLPNLVTGNASPVVTSSSKTDGIPTARMPDVVLGVAGTPSSDKLTGSCNPTNSSDKLDVNHSENTDQPTLIKAPSGKSSEASVAVRCDALPTIVKKDLVVNGTTKEPLVLNTKATIVNPVQTKVPAVNGAQTNGVLFVGKEEHATKMTPAGQEVVISVVENPRKPSTGPSEEVNKGSVVLGKKRPKSVLGDITTAEKGESALLINGPFVASEMLRNVAKRQRRLPEDPSLVNGSSEQKGPMAWDELVRAQPKPLVATPKLPIAVNGVRLDILSEHARDLGSRPDARIPSSDKNLHTANPVSTVANTTNLNNYSNIVATGNHGNTTNAGLGNQGIIANTSLGSQGNMANNAVASQINVMNSAPNHAEIKSPAIVTTNFVPGGLPPVTTQGQSSGSNTSTQSVTTTVAVATSVKDQSANDNPRGQQAAGVALPYGCLWAGCNCSFANSKLLYNHAVSVHAPPDQLFTSCQWEGCTHVRRSRASLLFHLRQRHLSPAQHKEQNVAPKPQKPLPPAGPIPPPSGAQPTTVPSHGRQTVLPPHPSVNPLLLNLKEQLLQTEQESPLTKSVRLTAALVLRNIAKYSPSGRRKLKPFESSFTEIMCSKLESNGAIAACLHEMTRPRNENSLPKR